MQGDTALTDAITPSQIKALSSLLGNQNAVTTDLIAAFRFSSELSNLMGLHASKFGNKSIGGKHLRDDHFQDELVGKEIRKQFTGGYFNGRVEHYNSKSKMFHIVYDDGDEEDLEKDDVIRYNQCWKVFQAQQLSKKFLNQQSKKTPYDYEGDFVMNSSNSDDEMKGVRQHLRSGRPVGLPPQDDTGRPMIWDQTEHRWRAAGIKDTKKTVITGVEMFRKLLDTGEAGDNIGALLRGVERTDIERGQVLAKPGSVTPHTEFEAQAYVLKKEEGGRHTPFFTKYRPQFYFRTTDVTGEVTLPSGTEMVMPGDDAKFNVKLITPIAMNEKLNFAIREGGKTVGAGVVTKIIK